MRLAGPPVARKATRFAWRDGERTIHFGRGIAAQAVEACGGPGYLLLTTPRAQPALPALTEAAAAVQHVPGGVVSELAAAALAQQRGSQDRIVALGGGRVIDVAKAVAAARGDARAMAVPTTLSGAEMTCSHQHAAAQAAETPHVRCSVVVCDPALVASQPLPELAASALNALAHAVEAPCTVTANPLADLAARDAARRLVGAFAAAEPDRDELALGALLAGYVVDSAGYGLHHVLAQTLVQIARISHAQANAIMLPHTCDALARRFPGQQRELEATLGEEPAAAAARLGSLTGVTRLRDADVTWRKLEVCVETAAARPQLAATPPPAALDELRALYRAAW